MSTKRAQNNIIEGLFNTINIVFYTPLVFILLNKK
jgi:hypothetical protein